MSKWIIRNKKLFKFFSFLMTVISTIFCTIILGTWETVAIGLLILSLHVSSITSILD